MPTLKLTDSAIDRLPAPSDGTVWYSDPELRGFQLAIGKRTRTFYAIKAMNGRNVRKKLGQHPMVKARAARDIAMGVLGEISMGIDPRHRKTDTLRGALEDYIDVYSHASHARLSKTTAGQYKRVLELHCSSWLDRDLGAISKPEVAKLHRDLRDKPYTANQCLRVLRMMFKHAIETRDYDLCDPTRGVKFYAEQKRETKIDDAKAWYAEVQKLPVVRRNYYLLAALTGIRRTNLAELEWLRVNLQDRTVKLVNIKNGSSPTLPLSSFACELLGELRSLGSSWVFPANSKSGHLEEPKDKVRGRIHDLRRMFTTAGGRVHLPEYVIARLRGDIAKQTVVQGYMGEVFDHEAADKIANYLKSEWVGGGCD